MKTANAPFAAAFIFVTLTIFVAAPAFANPPGSETPPVMPLRFAQNLYVDEAADDPDFLAYRAELAQAIARHDLDLIANMAASDIFLDYGGGSGRELFRERLADDDYLAELAEVIHLGGGFDEEGRFNAPFTQVVDPEGLDRIDPLFIAGANIAMRETPDAEAPIIARLSFSAAKPDGLKNEKGFTFVTLPDGREGYVNDAYIRSFYDYRAFFEKVDDVWRMTIFIAGD